MSDWWRDMPSAEGPEILNAGVSETWPDRAFEPEHSALIWCPVGASEMLAVAQALPLRVRMDEGGPVLVACLAATDTRMAAFSEAGAWRLSYKPQALRMLPFLALPDGQIQRLRRSDAYPDLPRDKALQDRMQAILGRAAQDYAEARAMARDAMEAGWLAPQDEERFLAPTEMLAARFDDMRLSARQARAYRLLVAIGFSQKNARVTDALKPHFAQNPVRLRHPETESLAAQSFLFFDDEIEFD